ncbi:MAG: class IV adenylate cyclase [Patescibacteria group bacterium]|jgi:adenylate cyclase class 2
MLPIEYEATFCHINKDDIRQRLKKAGAQMIYPEFLMKRYVWNFPKGHEVKGGWIRVRQEADKITMSVKVVPSDKKIKDQKEACIEISDFDKAREIINALGCQEMAYQESKRELWKIGQVEITIDEWPFLEPFVEIEGSSEQVVKDVAQKLDFDYSQAMFGSVDFQYAKKYKLPLEKINRQTPKILFNMPNPFLKK